MVPPVVATVGERVTDATERLRASGSETPRLDAELLLGFAVGADRTTIVAHPEAAVGPDAAARFEEAVMRRERGEPVAYIRGFKEFHGLAFAVDRRALIPRPETEALVEAGIREVLRRLSAAGPAARPVRLVDVGSGSGAVAVALAVALRGRRVQLGRDVAILATDSSAEALDLARENAVGHAVAENMLFADGDLIPAWSSEGEDAPKEERFDLVVANLPYVRSDAISGLPVAASFEPRAALDGGPDGLAVIRRLLGRLAEVLVPGGAALLEIGADQGDTALAAGREILPGWPASVERDLAGLPRILRVERPGI